MSSIFKDSEELLSRLPGRKRRWQITVFRNDAVDGGIKNTVVEHFDNVRSCDPITGRITRGPDTLHFIDETGREIEISSLPFIVKEIKQGTESDQVEQRETDN